MNDEDFKEYLKNMSPEDMDDIIKEYDYNKWLYLKELEKLYDDNVKIFKNELYDSIIQKIETHGYHISDENLIEDMIHYYCELEEYEKCNLLVKQK